MGEAGAVFTPLVALIMLAFLGVVVVFSFMWVFYMFAGPLHGTHPQEQQSRQRFCYFFPPPDLLYPVDIVLRILLKQPSTETHHSGEEWGVCSPSSQCEAEPITGHNARFWETLGCF